MQVGLGDAAALGSAGFCLNEAPPEDFITPRRSQVESVPSKTALQVTT